MSIVVENKSAVTHNLLEQLQKSADKISFIPDTEIVDAIRLLEDKGIPNNKHEDYKYCNVEAVLRREFKAIENTFNEVTNADIASFKIDEAINIIVLNGTYNEALSEKIIVKGLTVKKLTELSTNEQALISSQAKSSNDA